MTLFISPLFVHLLACVCGFNVWVHVYCKAHGVATGLMFILLAALFIGRGKPKVVKDLGVKSFKKLNPIF